MSYIAKQTWNEGVMKTFKFLRDLPDTVSHYTQHGMDMAMSNEDFKKMFDTVGGQPESAAKQNK